MKLCWEATGGAPGSCVRGPLTNTTKSPLLKIPKESKVWSGFKYVLREHVGLDGMELSVCLSKI